MSEGIGNEGIILSNTPDHLSRYNALGSNGNYRDDFFSDQDFYLFRTKLGIGLVLVDGTRVHLIDEALASQLECASTQGRREDLRDIFVSLGFYLEPLVDDCLVGVPPPRAFSLAVAQKCNLGCTYCYASGGDFGSVAKKMAYEVAVRSVDRLMDGVCPGERVNLAFLGGEPLVNRSVLIAATEYAAEQAIRRGIKIGFSITTNGTLITPDDGAFFERHKFAVTVSLDGVGSDHDLLRPFKSGRGSFDHIVARLQPLLEMQRGMQVSARVTVTPRNLNLRSTLDHLVSMGFHSVGFSPMVSSPTGRDQMAVSDFATLLDQMIACGTEFEHRITNGQHYPFSNIVSALSEIHRGTHRPYSCGAGGAYFGVSAEGGISACHRFVESETGQMGHIDTGVDVAKQSKWLADRHVHHQTPCNQCWARYMCGGGCHHEVIHRGRVGCDYIRGWLHYALETYVRLIATHPEYFGPRGGLFNAAPVV
ncbi:SPASM domain-containing protein [Mesorhizobium sp. CO1-1-11]|uniref:radical SAM/SPASM domain-containing protein n=1 Tax=Mesorhizobium sp. CO1-1-11 TaxID=2876636 RepID=UPI001CCDA243|nr:radical SAM protein [Mesorhizobium sp. CO1-1-11]MBZ9728046.1 SPASM domain-containing protein [Mesorhizobium sp. CO1-1-11]